MSEQCICKQCQTSFEITDGDRTFYEQISPVFHDKKFHLPAPTLCPDCRQQRRSTWLNLINFYQTTCGKCQRPVISIYSPDKPFTIYCQQCFLSDSWDPLVYGQDFDFSRPFFDQFSEFIQKVPQLALFNDNGFNSENCEYTNSCARSRNCYCAFNTIKNENVFYSYYADHSKFCSDVLVVTESEYCYECIDCNKCYHCKYLINSSTSNNCSFGYDLRGCSNCFGCFNLRNKSYYIFNQPYSKEEYQQKISAMNISSWSVLQKTFQEFLTFILQAPRKPLHHINTENCYGDYITKSKDSWGFDLLALENSRYIYQATYVKNCHDCMDVANSEWSYEAVSPDHSYHGLFTVAVTDSSDCFYSLGSLHCQNLFGCSSLTRKKYCIFNKQYTKEEYETVASRIIEHMIATGEWGEFFPSLLTPFSYNESKAQEYYPLTKEKVLQMGWQWKDKDPKEYQPSSYVIPEDILRVSDEILKETLACSNCGKNYRINPLELELYRSMDVPIPHKCFHCRHQDRMNLRNPRKICERTCAKCGNSTQTTYSPDRPEIVYCEKCYLEVLY